MTQLTVRRIQEMVLERHAPHDDMWGGQVCSVCSGAPKFPCRDYQAAEAVLAKLGAAERAEPRARWIVGGNPIRDFVYIHDPRT
jgi:hypothetical protein